MNQQQLSLNIASDTAKRSTSSYRTVRSNESVALGISRDEMNLAEFPLAVLSTRSDPNIKTLQFRDSQRLKNGEIIEREWLITGADKFGLPTSTDDDVVLGLIRLSMNHGFRDRKIYFTRYELLKILKWTTEGRSYQRLARSLDRLSGVRIRATNAFYDNSLKSYQTVNFGIIDSYEINVERGTKQAVPYEQPKSHFVWSEMLFDSFKAGFIKKLDLDFYFNLQSAVSRRLYRFLDKHFYYKPSLEISLQELAFEKLGVSRNYKYISSLKQQIEPALEELKSSGFLSGVEFVGAGACTAVRFLSSAVLLPVNSGRPGSLPQRGSATPTISSARSCGSKIGAGETRSGGVEFKDRLIGELVIRGISRSQAERLMSQRNDADCGYIEIIINYYDHLVASRDHKISRSPVGFLFRAVQNPDKFTVPKYFLSQTRASAASPNNVRSKQVGGSEKSVASEVDYRRYREFVGLEVANKRKQMGEHELQLVYTALEKKMASLRSVLDKVRFNEALEGCVTDEIARLAGIPTFRNWLQKQVMER